MRKLHGHYHRSNSWGDSSLVSPVQSTWFPLPLKWSHKGLFLCWYRKSNLYIFHSLTDDLKHQLFGSEPTCSKFLESLILTLFNHTTKLLTRIQVTIQTFLIGVHVTKLLNDCFAYVDNCDFIFYFFSQDFTVRPDIADDCFLLASRCIRYCPDLFCFSPVFPSLVDCAMIGITIQHRHVLHHWPSLAYWFAFYIYVCVFNFAK